MIDYSEFEKVEIHVGRIVAVEDFPKARKPAYKLTIDFGPLGIKRSSAQITAYYAKESLTGMQVLAVTNFAPRQIADFLSEVLVLGVVDDRGSVVLINPERELPLGLRVS